MENLKVKEINELAEKGPINLNFLSYTRLKKDVNRSIVPGKKYNGVPKLVKLNYEVAKPFHLVGTIPEYFKKVIKGSNRYRAVISPK